MRADVGANGRRDTLRGRQVLIGGALGAAVAEEKVHVLVLFSLVHSFVGDEIVLSGARG